MKYYLTIGSSGVPTLVYTESDNTKWDKSGFTFCAEIDRVSAITISRILSNYVQALVKSRDHKALDMVPFVVPYDIMKPNGDLDVAILDSEIKNGSLALVDNFLYK